MSSITIRFYEELNDFLPKEKRKKNYTLAFSGKVPVKHIIENEGVPHGEVDLVLANGSSVDFSYVVIDGDYISVYPVFESLDISSVTHLREKPLRDPRFIADVHLGKLARYLRLLGFDTLYRNDYEDPRIVEISREEKRIILTRDIGLLKRKNVSRGYWIRSSEAGAQLEEVIKRFDLADLIKPFTFCLTCNGPLEESSAEAVAGKVDDLIREKYHEFYFCSLCGKIYWKGYHYPGLEHILKQAGLE